MKTLQELLGLNKAKQIDIETFSGKSIPSRASVIYAGENLSKLIDKAQTQIDAAMAKVTAKFRGDLDFQDVYLGYSRSRDFFIQGYDGWGTKPNDFDQEGEDPDAPLAFKCSPFIIFKLEDDGDIDVIKTGVDATRAGKTWYAKAGGLSQVRQDFSDLIDIRKESD